MFTHGKVFTIGPRKSFRARKAASVQAHHSDLRGADLGFKCTSKNESRNCDTGLTTILSTSSLRDQEITVSTFEDHFWGQEISLMLL